MVRIFIVDSIQHDFQALQDHFLCWKVMSRCRHPISPYHAIKVHDLDDLATLLIDFAQGHFVLVSFFVVRIGDYVIDHDLTGFQGSQQCGYTSQGPQILGAGDQGGSVVETVPLPGIDPVPP